VAHFVGQLSHIEIAAFPQLFQYIERHPLYIGAGGPMPTSYLAPITMVEQ